MAPIQSPKVLYRIHAIQRMFGRNISLKSVSQAIQAGEIIEDYSVEMPEPAQLILSFQGKRPFHVVMSRNHRTNEITIITVYLPDPGKWNKSFTSRKS